MIDTDKYEGHSEGSWEWVIPEWGDDHIHDSEGNLIAQVTNIDEMQMNARLIADAPLLLEEVKRLREDNKKLHDAINGCAYTNMQGSAHDLYCESMVERCPICDENVESGCDPYCESMEGR
tara:strand:- start:220 stop:582 length:363 start_codon:yes stop_codon:yes gene_type:complete